MVWDSFLFFGCSWDCNPCMQAAIEKLIMDIDIVVNNLPSILEDLFQ